ncbi:GNAT family N-acetyltransferase [Nakamurella sp. YIM 132087]|uniref:GNAT family N-acetyltransferase n=1 Tax=Nakamurella alba TaxID=2665158 RepID=A0A7K1FN23_9ACTN|nr:GNAT family N-acetyltransferase [Nakamurella alba]
MVRLWPVFGLLLRTPRLELRPLCDDDLAELIDLVRGGVHDPAEMPFLMPWTDAPDAELVANTLRYHWQARAASVPERWSVNFAVRIDGELAGTQELMATDFAVTRSVSTGSWLGLPFQGRGIGSEMRAAVLLFAFDQLGAVRAESSAFTDNPRSLRVSEKLGYLPDGTRVIQRRPGERATDQRLLLTPRDFRRPVWELGVEGFAPCRPTFGIV